MTYNELDETFEFKFGSKTFKLNVADDLEIIEEGISDEFMKQAPKYAYVAMLTSYADGVRKVKKVELEEIEAEIDQRTRALHEQENKKFTEKTISSAVITNDEVKRVKREYLKAEETYTLLRSFEEAYKMRSDMLIRIGAQQRSEMGMIGRDTMKVQQPKEDPVKMIKEKLKESRE